MFKKTWHFSVALGLLIGALAAAQLILLQHGGEQPVDFKIGETTLAIPQSYFDPGGLPEVAWYLEQDGVHESDDKEKVEFSLCIVWPKLESCNFNVWQERQLLVLVQNKSDITTGKKQFELFYKSRESEISDGPSGFRKFTWVSRDYMFKGDIDEPKELVTCNQIGSVPHPGCEREVTIGTNNLVMQFTFSRRDLDEMLTIQRAIIDKMNAFRRSGPPFSADGA